MLRNSTRWSFVGPAGPLVRLVLFRVMLALAASCIVAQTINGSISGRVLDASGAVVPGAKIAVRNLETGLPREAQTDVTGVYQVRALPVGRYSVSFSAAGFETLVRQPVEVQMSVDVFVEATLSPGVAQQVVSVVGEAPLIEVTQSQVSSCSPAWSTTRTAVRAPRSRSTADARVPPASPSTAPTTTISRSALRA